MINIKNLQKTFGKNEVLKGIDLEIEAGEVVVIIGPSGSGKSTFLRCLNLLETPTGGSVEFEGKNLLPTLINFVKKWEWYSKISIFSRIKMSWKT